MRGSGGGVRLSTRFAALMRYKTRGISYRLKLPPNHVFLLFTLNQAQYYTKIMAGLFYGKYLENRKFSQRSPKIPRVSRNQDSSKLTCIRPTLIIGLFFQNDYRKPQDWT